jgi:hypothetical protein
MLQEAPERACCDREDDVVDGPAKSLLDLLDLRQIERYRREPPGSPDRNVERRGRCRQDLVAPQYVAAV